eukprot:scaffold209810_cov28-Tisochrysis_lutea.AAC.1
MSRVNGFINLASRRMACAAGGGRRGGVTIVSEPIDHDDQPRTLAGRNRNRHPGWGHRIDFICSPMGNGSISAVDSKGVQRACLSRRAS